MLTPAEFADAVRKGLGRAVLVVDGPVSQEYEDIILAACQTDQRHDPQFEDSRAPYLMALAERACLVYDVRQLIVAPIEETLDDWDRLQRLRMLGEFAKRSNFEVVQLLRRYAEEMDSNAWTVLADCGELNWLVDNILPIMPTEDKWEVMLWANLESDLPSDIKSKLTDAYEECASLRKSNTEENERDLSFGSVIQRIEQGNRNMLGLKRIGPNLTESQVLEVADRWLSERDFRKGIRYAGLFEVRKFPLPIEAIIDLIYIGNAPAGFEEVLGSIDNPKVREVGLWMIHNLDYRGFQCLRKSGRPDDIPKLLTSLEKYQDEPDEYIHMLNINLRQVIETWSDSDRFPFLIWIYEHNPCSVCRSSAAKMMVDDGTLPDEYRREMQFDADSYCRELAAKNQSTN